MRFLTSALAVFCLALSAVSAQAPIPQRPPGAVHPASGDASAPISFEVFIDPICPDSKAAWPTVKAVAEHYGASARVLTNTFPLPYHTWSFLTSQAATVLAQTYSNDSVQYAYYDWIFANQEAFGNAATAGMTAKEVTAALAAGVAKAGLAPEALMAAGLEDATANWNTRVVWKFGCGRAVLGTPTFFVNGVPVAGESTWTLSEWKVVLDPLVRAAKPVGFYTAALRSRGTCAEGTTECEYLPGKIECCPPNDYCIPNVGCRC